MRLPNISLCVISIVIVVVYGQGKETIGDFVANFEQTNETVPKLSFRPVYVVTSDINETSDVNGTNEAFNLNSTDDYGDVLDDPPKMPGRPGKPGNGQSKSKSSKIDDDSLPWAIGGIMFGVVIILLIVIIGVVSKSSKHSKINRSFTHDFERFPDYNGPPTVSETISIPSQTDGSISQGDQSMKEDDITGYSDISKKENAKPPAQSVSCEDFTFQ